MTDIQEWLDQGKTLAGQATQGPWEADGCEVTQHWSRPEPWQTIVGTEVSCMGYCYGGSAKGVERDEDAEFIADARTRLPQALNALQAVHNRHHKITRYGNDEYSISAEEYLESPEDYAGLEPFDLCAECLEVELELLVAQSEYPMSIGLRSAWPCPTVRAITDAIGGGDE